jgi:uncharacterized protein (UPF0333 family)
MEFSWSTLIIVILIIIIIYFLWSMLSSSSSSTVISGSQDAKTQTSVSIPDNSYSFAISTWIYVTDWESTSGDKVIISSESDASKTTPNLLLSLGKNNNALSITLGKSGSTVIPPIPNIPLQTWVSIILNVNNGSSVDIYINGKLVQTSALQGPWSLSAGSLYVGSKNGFDGYITMATFHKAPLGPQDAWDTYSSGYGASGSSSAVDFFNKYKVRFAFVKDNVELSRLDI